MAPKNLALLAALFLSFIILAVLFFSAGGEEGMSASQAGSIEAEESASDEPMEMKTVILLFPSESDALLHPEERLVRVSSSVLDEIRQTLQELIEGSTTGLVSPFPETTEIRGLYLTDEGVAYVDLSKDVDRPELYGAEAELLTIYSVVNTLAGNFGPVKRVFILVDGGQMETLGGHVDLGRAFLPLESLNSR